MSNSKEHPEMEYITQGSEKSRWALNIIFHMIDKFDKEGGIKEIKINNLQEDELAKLSKEFYSHKYYNYKKRKFITNEKHQYCLYLDTTFMEECYNDQINDPSITTNYFELIALHEFAHLKYFHHKKSFIRHWKRLLKRWNKIDAPAFKNYFRRQRKMYRRYKI